jgi:hypothetical protein
MQALGTCVSTDRQRIYGARNARPCGRLYDPQPAGRRRSALRRLKRRKNREIGPSSVLVAPLDRAPGVRRQSRFCTAARQPRYRRHGGRRGRPYRRLSRRCGPGANANAAMAGPAT